MVRERWRPDSPHRAVPASRRGGTRLTPAQPDGFQPGLVTLVIPAKDEEAALGSTLEGLPLSTLHAAGFRSETLVLDGNSHDATRDIAYKAGGVTVVYDRLAGKGNAFRNAIPLFQGDYVIMLDADGTYAPDAIPRLLSPLAWGEADIVVGRRIAQPGALTGQHRIGNALLSLAARLLYAKPCPDLCSGLWAFRRDALLRLPLRSRRFDLEAELFCVSTRLALRVRHVAVDYLPRQGQSKLSAADAVRIAWRLVRTRIEPLPHVLPPPPRSPDAPRPHLAIAPAGEAQAPDSPSGPWR